MRWQQLAKSSDGREVWFFTEFEGEIEPVDLTPDDLDEHYAKFRDQAEQSPVLGVGSGELEVAQQIAVYVSSGIGTGIVVKETVEHYLDARDKLREFVATLRRKRMEPAPTALQLAEASSTQCVFHCLGVDNARIVSPAVEVPPDQILVELEAGGRPCRVISNLNGDARFLEVGPRVGR